jgi:hypothetical protein
MFYRSLALSLIVTVAGLGPSMAAPNCVAVQKSQGCSCVVPIVPQTPVGRITGLGGDIKRTGPGSYTSVKMDTPINVGDGLLFGKDGHGFLSAGPGCQNLKLGAFTSLVVRAVAGCACITSVDGTGAPVGPAAPAAAAAGTGGSGAIAPLAALGAAGGGIALFSTQDTQNDP